MMSMTRPCDILTLQDKYIYVPDPDHGFGKSNKVLDYQKSIGSTLFLD